MPGQHKILIADEDLPSADLLREVLEQVHYQVLVAHDGVKALKLAKEERPDLAILAVMLPSLNGFEVCERLRNDPEFGKIPVIMLTILNEAHHRIRAHEAGANEFLTKPFDRPELFTKIRSLLGFQDEVAQGVSFEDVIECLLTGLEGRWPEAVSHARRVAQLAEQLGPLNGLDPNELKELAMGALLHDIGKLGLNQIKSPAGDDLEESGNWRKHTLLGDQMLSKLNHPPVQEITRSHHEHMDGSGFPDGLKGNQLSVQVRIVAVCNRFDHLTEGWIDNEERAKKAVAVLKEEAKAGRWDPRIVGQLEQLTRLYFGL